MVFFQNLNMSMKTKLKPNNHRRFAFPSTSLIVFLTILTICSNSALGANLKSDDLFRPDKLLEIQIKMPPADWEKLRKESDRRNRGFSRLFSGSRSTGNRFNLYKADIIIDGITIKNIGIRTKGFIGSLNPERPSLKVKFDEYVDQSPIEELDRLTLNNNVQDESLASQFLTYRLFNKAGIPAPRINHATVTVNNEYLGVYSHVESVRGPFIRRHFGDYSGELYEGTISDFYPMAVENIEAKNKQSKKKRTQAVKLAKILETKESFKLKEAEKYLNIDQFLKFWAMESLLGFWDGYTNNQNNYYAYSSPNDDGRFHFVPWGADGAFTEGRGPFSRFGGDDNAPQSVYSQSMLSNRLFRADGIPERYKEALEEILLNVWKEDEIKKEINRIEALTRNQLHPQQDRTDRGIDRLLSFVEARRFKLESELKNWPVKISGDPRIPMHSVEIGELKGTFETVWNANRLENANNFGNAQIELSLNGEKVSFSKLGVVGQPEEPPRWFGGRERGRPQRGRELNPTVTFNGVSKKSGEDIIITLTIDRENFATGKNEVSFQGSFLMYDANENQDGFGFERFRSMKTLVGTLNLSAADMKDGARVSGTLKTKINERRGGFLGGGRSRGPRR